MRPVFHFHVHLVLRDSTILFAQKKKCARPVCLADSGSECQSEVKPHDQKEHELKSAEQVATLPMRMGGLGRAFATQANSNLGQPLLLLGPIA